MLAFLYCLKLKIKVDTVVGYIYSKYHAKCKFVSKFIQLVTITNLFPLGIVQKCQHCALWENSNRSTVQYRIPSGFTGAWLSLWPEQFLKNYPVLLIVRYYTHCKMMTDIVNMILYWQHSMEIIQIPFFVRLCYLLPSSIIPTMTNMASVTKLWKVEVQIYLQTPIKLTQHLT